MLLAVAGDMKPGKMNSVTSAFLKRSSISPKHRLWTAFHKPILALLVGGLLFGAGTAASLLYFTQLGNVPYLVGPVLLSVGLMFLVTGLVWMPVIKQRMEHKALTQMNYSKFTSEVSGGYTRPCPSISQSVDLLA
ncbi:phosphoinositide-interacting protein-like [Sardina pilchardus]|uniref:phosphoinositide-interacting protein-like n=1 Tax=Sardina pilchardus TaxID=27697 RepID=UPI002E1072D9